MLVTFEPLDLEQSYIPHLKALMCGINAAEAQRCDCMFTFCYAYPKMGVLLHKMANASHSSSGTVHTYGWTHRRDVGNSILDVTSKSANEKSDLLSKMVQIGLFICTFAGNF